MFLLIGDIFFSYTATRLSDGAQQLAVGVEDDAEGQQQTEGEQADYVGDIVGRLAPPVHRAGRARTLRPIAAPAHQRWYSPAQRVEPGEADPRQHRTVVAAAGYSGGNHGAIAFIGQDCQGDEGDDACGSVKVLHNLKAGKLYFCHILANLILSKFLTPTYQVT